MRRDTWDVETDTCDVRRDAFHISCRCIAVFALVFCFASIGIADDWKVLKGQHFLVYYLDEKGFANETLNSAEKYYDRIASDLGYSRYDKFWQWENRVKIYIYRDYEEFNLATGRQGWVLGIARYKEKEIISYKWNQGFLKTLLPHELTHLIFRDFVGFENENIPLWLDEGIAQWEEEGKREQSIRIVKKLIEEKNFIPLGRLMAMDVRRESDPNISAVFYAEAVTIVGYLIKQFSGTRFSLFCRELRDGKDMDQALSFVYTNSIKDVDDLNEKWMKYYGGM